MVVSVTVPLAVGELAAQLYRVHSDSVGLASLVDFGQFYKSTQYIIRYMYIYMYYTPAKHVSNLGRRRLAPPPIFPVGKSFPVV